MAIPLLGALGLGLKALRFGKNLISPGNKIGDAVKVIQALRDKGDRTSEFESAVRVKQIEADRDVAVAQVKASETSWKDEFILVIITFPYIMLFLIGVFGVVDALVGTPPEGIERFDLMLTRFDTTIHHLEDFPNWYTYGIFIPIGLACFGIKAHGIMKNGSGRSPDSRV